MASIPSTTEKSLLPVVIVLHENIFLFFKPVSGVISLCAQFYIYVLGYIYVKEKLHVYDFVF
jgi:hypothetical protein